MSSVGGAIHTTIGRVSATVLAVAAVGAGILAVPGATGGGGSSDPVANVWIVPSGGGCSSRATSPVTLAAASTAQKCDSADGFEAAFLLMGCGDTALIDTGDYGNQTIDTGHSGSCAQITLAAAPGETVHADDLVLQGANNIRIAGDGWDGQNAEFGTFTVGESDPTVGSMDVRSGTNLTVDGIDFVTSGQFAGGTNVTARYNDIGPYANAGCPMSGVAIGNAAYGADLVDPVFVGNYTHDFEVGACSPPNDHLDCWHIYEHVTGSLTIDGNVFDDCENYGILYGSSLDSSAENATIVNNWFGPVDTNCGFALRGGAGESFTNVLVAFNSGTSCVTTQTTNSLTNVDWIGNAVSSVAPCRANTYSHNKQSAGSGDAVVCGTGDAISQSLDFVSTSTNSLDFHVGPSSALKDAGPATCTDVPEDYDGDARPAGAACDVGADEVG